MLRKLHFRPSPAMAVALAALVVALGGVAFASIPARNGVFKVCYDSRGAMRVIDSSASCQAGETQILLDGPAALNLARPYGAFTVDSRGHVHIEDQSGIQGVTRLSRGKFCVKPRANFNEVVSVASAGFNPNAVALAYTKIGNPACPAGSLEVITGVLQSGKFVLQDESFQIDPTG
jgi:hypothetical protein